MGVVRRSQILNRSDLRIRVSYHYLRNGKFFPSLTLDQVGEDIIGTILLVL